MLNEKEIKVIACVFGHFADVRVWDEEQQVRISWLQPAGEEHAAENARKKLEIKKLVTGSGCSFCFNGPRVELRFNHLPCDQVPEIKDGLTLTRKMFDGRIKVLEVCNPDVIVELAVMVAKDVYHHSTEKWEYDALYVGLRSGEYHPANITHEEEPENIESKDIEVFLDMGAPDGDMTVDMIYVPQSARAETGKKVYGITALHIQNLQKDFMKRIPRVWIKAMIERQRQIDAEGFTSVHDDQHTNGELAKAAACYAFPEFSQMMWPTLWLRDWFKPSPENRKREIIKAMALLAAEYERLERMEEVEEI